MYDQPSISILIPTLNAASVLEKCLDSIRVTSYPQEKIEIIVADGGSTDATVEIAKKHNAVVVQNVLKTAEAGKMAALKHSSGEFIALIDSDNILSSAAWFDEMLYPLLKHPEAVGSEPWSYTWRQDDGFITRYCALIGMNDPLVHFLGNYDRLNLLTGKWTETAHEEQNFENYLLCKFGKRGIPTIGANGTVFRTSFLKKYAQGDYLFDIDILAEALAQNDELCFVKVKNGIVHTYCESDVAKFARKQKRRVHDFLYHKTQKARVYEWSAVKSFSGLLKFILSCVLVIPLFIDAFRGYAKKKDIAWFFHIVACEITLWEYSWGVFFGLFKRGEVSRNKWSQ